MGVTLGEILGMNVLKDAKIITDTYDRETPVENITIMEAPDIANWVDKGSILLTGLYAIGDDDKKLQELVDSLASRNICAMLVKVNRFIEAVPQCIIDAGNKYGIAIVEIPFSVRYIDIMYPVIAAIFDSQVIKLSYFKQTLNSLSSLALSNKGMKSVASLFAELISNPVVLYDSEMQFIYTTDSRFKNMEWRKPVKEAVYGDISYRIFLSQFAGIKGDWPQLMVPVRVFGKPKIYVSIIEWNHPMTELDFIAVENVITVFGFEMMKDYVEEEAERQFQNQLVDDIRRGRNPDSIKERLRSVRLNADSKYTIMVVETPPRPINRTPSIVNRQPEDDNITRSYELFSSLRRSMGIAGIEAYRFDGIVAVLEQPGDSAEAARSALEDFCRQYTAALEKELPDIHVNIGYSSAFYDILYISELYEPAKQAVHLSKLLYGQNAACDYEQLGVLKLLGMIKNRDELQNYLPPSVRRLYEHEAESPGLVETLECYFNHNGNIQQTAKALFIHYKTLYYRLNKIRSITNADLKNSSQALEIQLGLVVAKLYQNK